MENTDIDPSTDIWHYRFFPSFVAILQTKALWFTRLNELPDPFEARGQLEHKSWLTKKSEEHERSGFVNCWTIDQEESELMWYAYAPTFGVAIRTSVGKLIKSLSDTNLTIREVKYKEDWSNGTPETFAFTKRAHFKREQELRVFCPYKPTDTIHIDKLNPGISIEVDLELLVHEVWVSPFSPIWFKKVVQVELEKYGLKQCLVKRRLVP